MLVAQILASAVVASRAGDPEPDRTRRANLVRRASHLVVDLDDRIARLELPRGVVGGRGRSRWWSMRGVSCSDGAFRTIMGGG